MNTDQDLESMLWLARQTSFMAGREAERERILKKLEEHDGIIPVSWVVAIIKGEDQ